MSEWRSVPCHVPDKKYGVVGFNGNGYSYFHLEDGTIMLGHRWSFLCHYGWLPVVVGHRCDNPPCIEPLHLFGGTQADNMRDCSEKGRARGAVHTGDDHWSHRNPQAVVRGINHGRAVLNDDAVRAIRAAPRGSRELADRFGISYTHLKRIRRGVGWSHV